MWDIEARFEKTCQNHQGSLRKETRDVVEAALPACIGSLLLRGKTGDVQTVSGDVMCRRTERDYGEKSERVAEIIWQWQAEGDQSQAQSSSKFEKDHEEFLGLKHLEQRTP